MSEHDRNVPQFYITPPQPCPYLAGEMERKVFTHLIGEDAGWLNNTLTHGGFRRSQNIAYRPACRNCAACVSVRVLVDEFAPSRSQKRVARLNADLDAAVVDCVPTSEHYSVFRGYIDSRHADGGMADMTVLDFAAMLEDSFVDTRLIEYRLPGSGLAAGALTDVLDDGLSMIYSYFEPDLAARSLGTFMILDHIRRARRLGLPFVYLGYWVKGSVKMDYKVRFQPQEHLTSAGWQRSRPMRGTSSDDAD